ncbi:LysR family transcriptional regulator [Photobacterium sp. SDRW27]|uniref:LysR family transcriptional regulator n=1 Tax=Photobacterium obscurum TaxID=2829490 RepID=UPI002243C107|nr:LysR family transcriptional regulator [Photobacterium obscurum]MCW8332178.1 LysR family transcriptional regulator [Photobacterium obscurum]
MDLDLNLLKVFLEVYQYQSYTKASLTLGITQPAVSASIKRLEQEIGESLFYREGRGMKPTAMAIRLAARFRIGFDEIQNALADRFVYSAYISETLAINLPDLPSISVEHTPANQEELIHNLKSLSIDLAVGIIMGKDHAIISEPIFRESTVVVCSNKHPRIGSEISKEEFYAENHTALATTWKGMDGFAHISQDSGEERKVLCKALSVSAVLLDIGSSERIAVIPHRIAMMWKDALGLKVLHNPIEHKQLEYSLAYHRRYHNTEKHRQLRETIKDVIVHQNTMP